MVCRRRKMPRYYDSKCTNRNIKRLDLENEVFSRIQNLETSGEIELSSKKEKSVKEYKKKIESLEKKVAKLLDLYLDNQIPKEALDIKLADLNKEKDILLKKIQEVDSENYEISAMEEYIKRGIPNLHECDLETQTAIIDLFINQIIVTKDGLKIIWNQ